MAHRRTFARVFRRRCTRADGQGGVISGLRPGWYVRVRRGGKEFVRFAGLERDTAVTFAHRLARESDRRDLLDEHAVPDVSFESFAGEYLRHAERTMTRASYAERRRLVERALIPFFASTRLAEVTTPHIHKFLATKADVSGATRNRHVTAISAIFRRAKEVGLIEDNPALRVRRAKEPVFPLTLVEEARQVALLGLLAEPMRTFFHVLLDAGLRLGEALRLLWSDVDFRAGTLCVRHSKAKRPRIVGLSARLQAALLAHKQAKTLPLRGPDAVFPGALAKGDLLQYSWRKAFKSAAAQVGCPSLRIHDLRHMAAVNLVRRGVDLPTVQAVLGHRTLLSTLRYAEYSDGSAPFRAARALDAMHADLAGKPGKPT